MIPTVPPPSLSQAQRAGSRILLVAIVLYVLIVCREAPLRSPKLPSLYSNSADKGKLPGKPTNYTGYMTPSPATAPASAVWKPTLCDATSLATDGSCQFFTAGTWTIPLSERLRRAAAAPNRQEHPCPPAAFNDALSRAECVAAPNHSLSFKFPPDVAASCAVPEDWTDALLQLLGRRLQEKATNSTSGDTVEPVRLLMLGNSVLRAAVHGFVRMLRGLADGVDRGTHSSFVYAATTRGDFTYLWDGTSRFSRESFLAAVKATVGGEVLVYVEYTFACTSFSQMEHLMEDFPASAYDVSMFLCNYQPRKHYLLDYKKRTLAFQQRIEKELHQMNPRQTIVLLTGSDVFHRFCWSCLSRQRDPQLVIYNAYCRRLVTKYEQPCDTGSCGRLVRLPHEVLMQKCGINVPDEIHTESILMPSFPKTALVVRGQPAGERYPDVSHLAWYLFAMLDRH